MTNNVKYWQLGEILDFGKYKGKSLEEVIKLDPKYIEWCLEKIEDFYLSAGAKKFLNKIYRSC